MAVMVSGRHSAIVLKHVVKVREWEQENVLKLDVIVRDLQSWSSNANFSHVQVRSS